MDGESDGTTEGLGERPDQLEQQLEQQPEQQPDQKPVAEPEDRVSAEQLVRYLERARFEVTSGRRGYHLGEVNAFLNRLVDAIHAGRRLSDLVRRHTFTTVRLEHGYDMRQVDDFLAAVVDLDPHAAGAKPEVGRNALLTRLFG
jgi:DivIVA domain-containing protein